MTVTAPPRTSRPSDPVDRDEHEALIEEAKQRARRRRLVYATAAAATALAGFAVFTVLDLTATSHSSTPRPSPQSAVPGAPSASRIAFMRGPGDRPAPWAIYVMNTDGTGVQRLVTNGYGTVWSPDGRKIAFSTWSKGGGVETDVANADGSARRTLAQHGGPSAWSPDGKTIAFVRHVQVVPGQTRPDVDRNVIYAVRVDGTSVRRLASNGALDGGITWSPDGRTLAFAGKTPGGNREIYVVNADGSGLRRLTRSRGLEHSPVWSPDDQRIAYTRTLREFEDWPSEIDLINADGSSAQRLTTPGAPRSPAWSPDGSRLVFVGDRSPTRPITGDGNDGIYVANADGSGLRRLTGNVGKEPGPAWSPDGSQIAFTGRKENIYVIGADGQGMKRLTRSPMMDWGPTWLPGK
jgi:Tol biopolymer transport system component